MKNLRDTERKIMNQEKLSSDEEIFLLERGETPHLRTYYRYSSLSAKAQKYLVRMENPYRLRDYLLEYDLSKTAKSLLEKHPSMKEVYQESALKPYTWASIRFKIASKQQLDMREVGILLYEDKEELVLQYLDYSQIIYENELKLVESGMKKAIRKQIKDYGISYPEAEVALMRHENIPLIKLLIKEQMVPREAEIALKKLGSTELEALYRKKWKFFLTDY